MPIYAAIGLKSFYASEECVEHVLNNTGITATAGIGTNLY